LIRTWKLSGLTKSAFSLDQQVSYHKFNYWQKRIYTPVRSTVDFVPVEVIMSRLFSADLIIVRSKSGMEDSFSVNK
jgi:hypothetical protein